MREATKLRVQGGMKLKISKERNRLTSFVKIIMTFIIDYSIYKIHSNAHRRLLYQIISNCFLRESLVKSQKDYITTEHQFRVKIFFFCYI